MTWSRMHLSAHGVQTEPSMAECLVHRTLQVVQDVATGNPLHSVTLPCSNSREGTTSRPPNPKVFRTETFGECWTAESDKIRVSHPHLTCRVQSFGLPKTATQTHACNNRTAGQLMGRPSRRQLPRSYRVHYAGSSKSAQCSSVSHPALCPASLVRTQIGGFAVWGPEEQSWML